MPGAERRHYAEAGKRAKDAACGPAARRSSDEQRRRTGGLLGTSAASQPDGEHRRVGSAGSAKRPERRMRGRHCVFPARQLIGLNSGFDPGMPDWIRGASDPMHRYVQSFFKGVFDRGWCLRVHAGFKRQGNDGWSCVGQGVDGHAWGRSSWSWMVKIVDGHGWKETIEVMRGR